MQRKQSGAMKQRRGQGRKLQIGLQPIDKLHHLSLVVDDRARFLLTTSAQLRRQSITQLLQQLADEHLAAMQIGQWTLGELASHDAPHRWCMLFSVSSLPMNHELSLVRTFVLAHAHFFYDPKGKPHRKTLPLLWPDIEDLTEEWHKTRLTEPYRVAKRMADALKKEGIEVES